MASFDAHRSLLWVCVRLNRVCKVRRKQLAAWKNWWDQVAKTTTAAHRESDQRTLLNCHVIMETGNALEEGMGVCKGSRGHGRSCYRNGRHWFIISVRSLRVVASSECCEVCAGRTCDNKTLIVKTPNPLSGEAKTNLSSFSETPRAGRQSQRGLKTTTSSMPKPPTSLCSA